MKGLGVFTRFVAQTEFWRLRSEWTVWLTWVPEKCLLSKCGKKHLVKKQLLKWRILGIAPIGVLKKKFMF